MSFASVAALLIFLLVVAAVIFLVLRPVSNRRVTVSYAYVPVLGVFLSLLAGSLSLANVRNGIVGDENIRPYGILILFMSLAYQSGSLDMTGVFAWLALKMAARARGSGPALFLLFFALSSFVTLVTSNDICIMTLTPIICYCTRATRVDPAPFVVAQFAAANLWSMALFIGNPTNIIVAEAHNMTFLAYSKWMALPTLAAGLSCLFVLRRQFGTAAAAAATAADAGTGCCCAIPPRLDVPQVDAASLLADRTGAIFGSVNILGCLGLLAAAPSLGWELWPVTLGCAALHAAYNVYHFVYLPRWRRRRRRRQRQQQDEQYRQQQVKADGDGDGWSAGDAPCAVPATGGGVGSGGAAEVSIALGTSPVWGAGNREVAAAAASGDGAAAPSGLLPAAGASAATPSGTKGNEPVAEQQTETPVGASICGNTALGNGNSSGSSASADGGAATVKPAPTLLQQPPASSQHLVSLSVPIPFAVDGAAPAAAASSTTAAVGPAAPPLPLPLPADALAALQPRQPSLRASFTSLPWDVVPFAGGMFVLVEALRVQGWVARFAAGLGAASPNLPLALLTQGVVSIALANVMNNQPMTILMASVCLDPKFVNALASPRNHAAALFAVIAGSNVGANFTPIGALAGIMWSNILGRQGYSIGYCQFVRLVAPSGLAAAAATLLVLWLEFAVFPFP